MSIFVSKERIPVTLDGVNVIYIKAKMDVTTRNKVQDALFQVHSDDGSTVQDFNVLTGRQNTVLLTHNIVAWEGPIFCDDLSGKLLPCIPQNIGAMDPDHPLLDAVLQEIERRNSPQPKDDPKNSGPGVVSAGVSVSMPGTEPANLDADPTALSL